MKNIKTIKTVEEFALMTSSETCILLNNDKRLAIVGETQGVDRKIIKRNA